MSNAVVSDVPKTGLCTSLDGNIERLSYSIPIPNEPLPGAPRHFFCTKFRANIRRTDCVGPIYSHIWRPKSNLDWNLPGSSYVAKPSYLHAHRTKVLMYTPFLRDKTLIFCTGVECTPACFLFAGNVGSLKTQIYKNIQEPKCMAHSFFYRERFGRGTVKTCKEGG